MEKRIRIIGFTFILCLCGSGSVFAREAADTVSSFHKELNEVVVTGTRAKTDIRHLPMTVSLVSEQTLTEKKRTSVLPTLAEQVPGLFVTSRGVMGYGVSDGGSGGINIRGLGGKEGRMMVLIDGHPQYAGVFGHPMADAYLTMMASQVEVLRGPSCVIYGSNAMGGVINIVTHGHAKQDGVFTDIDLGAGSYGTFQGRISNSVRKNKFSSSISFQYNRSDNHRPNMGFEQYGGHLNLGYDFTDNWRIFADADVTHFNASNPGTVSRPMLEADQWITRGAVNVGVENRYEKTEGAITLYSNFGFHKINDGYVNPAVDSTARPQNRFFRSRDALSGVSVYQSVRAFKGNLITVGFDWQHIYGRAYYTSRQTGEVLETPNKQSAEKNMDEVAGYINFRQDITHWVTLDAGVRYDYHTVSGGEWIPQGGIVFRPTATGELKATVGKGFRNPTLKEMYLYPPSNEELRAERILNYEISWKHRVAKGRVMYGINFFHFRGDNLIQTVNRQNVNTGKVSNSGVEAELAWRINEHWLLNTNHSYLYMKYPVVAAPTYKGYLGCAFSYEKWKVNAGFQYVYGLYTAVGENPATQNFPLLNLSVSYRPIKILELWVRGDNLLNSKYEINAGFPLPGATFMGGIGLHF